MAGKRTIWTILMLLLGSMSLLTAQVITDYYRIDGIRYVRSQEEVMYEDYFHGARFAVAAMADASGAVSYTLEVTYDEGMLQVSQGDSLTLVLRGGDKVILKTISDIKRDDILKRHFKARNYYYVTCRYAMSTYDVQRISRNRVTKMSAQAGDYTFDRKLDKFQDRFRRQLTAVYQHLNRDKR